MINHIAIWVSDLEKVRQFYQKYFNMRCSDKYTNEKKHFSSYFLSFEGQPTRLEIMNRSDIYGASKDLRMGFTHMAISVGSKKRVDELTALLQSDGYHIEGMPRTTGDGYYESVIADCEGNLVEITE